MPHTEARDYYVSLVRGKRVALLAGPFATHTQAIATVDAAVAEANRIDQWAWFDSFGTMSRPRDMANPIGKLNARLGIVHRPPC